MYCRWLASLLDAYHRSAIMLSTTQLLLPYAFCVLCACALLCLSCGAGDCARDRWRQSSSWSRLSLSCLRCSIALWHTVALLGALDHWTGRHEPVTMRISPVKGKHQCESTKSDKVAPALPGIVRIMFILFITSQQAGGWEGGAVTGKMNAEIVCFLGHLSKVGPFFATIWRVTKMLHSTRGRSRACH